MLSPLDGGKDSSNDPHDVFHTPPEESSLPTSSVNQAVDGGGTQGFADSGGAEFVDLGTDSDLGFSEGRLTQGIGGELVPECSRCVEGDVAGEVSESQFHEFRVLKREFSLKDDDLDVKKLKFSEQNSSFDSSGDCFGVELQKVEEGMGNCKGKLVSDTDTKSSFNFGADLQPRENVLDGEEMHVDAGNKDNCCREISMDKNLGSCENIESAGDVNFCEALKLPCMVEGNKSSHEVMEASEMLERSDGEPGLRVLPSSICSCLENAAKKLKSRKGMKKEKCPVFYVLKVLSENTDEVEDSVDSVSLLEAAKLRGITFPLPRWWPYKDNYKKQRIE